MCGQCGAVKKHPIYIYIYGNIQLVESPIFVSRETSKICLICNISFFLSHTSRAVSLVTSICNIYINTFNHHFTNFGMLTFDPRKVTGRWKRGGFWSGWMGFHFGTFTHFCVDASCVHLDASFVAFRCWVLVVPPAFFLWGETDCWERREKSV